MKQKSRRSNMLPRHRIIAVLLALVVSLFVCFTHLNRNLTPALPYTYTYMTVATTASREIINATLGFQRIFAINLPARSDRRDAMTLAAALSGLEITWVNGVAGQDVPDKVLPGDPESRQGGLTVGSKGCWRAHMDVLQRIVRENITSALILEDDADWDVRLKAQMQVFAQAARAFTQPLQGQPLSEQYRQGPQPELPFAKLPHRNLRPSLSAYGDDWDLLWLGHCGTDFPAAQAPSKPPPLRVTIENDMTVPSHQHLKPHPFALRDDLAEKYPPHTRVVHASSGTTCTQAYAVSRKGARKLLWQFGVETMTAGWDLMLRDWCDRLYEHPAGSNPNPAEATSRRRAPVCVTVQPPLFTHHYGKGAASDITAAGGGFVNRDKEMTPYVRLSVRLNMGRLVNGEPPVDQWEDG